MTELVDDEKEETYAITVTYNYVNSLPSKIGPIEHPVSKGHSKDEAEILVQQYLDSFEEGEEEYKGRYPCFFIRKEVNYTFDSTSNVVFYD